MSVINTQPLAGASGNQGVAGYNLTKSLRFRASASAYLNRTPSSTSDRQKMTFSFWCKRGTLGSTQRVFQSRDDGTAAGNNFTILFDSSNKLDIVEYASAYRINLVTTQVFRDPSAWYHIVLAIDTTQATDSNRVKLYVNGTQVTSFTTATYPSQNTSLYWNVASQPCSIGRYNDAGGSSLYFFDGYMAEANIIDGSQQAVTSFGETDSITGVWKPKAYTGTYGTNGFYLPFTDVATTSGSNAGLGKDFSGNGNYWNTNNISVTTGSTYDSMTDVPTLTDASTANYAVLNPLQNVLVGSGSPVFSDGNLKVASSAGSQSFGSSTISMSAGKFYAEMTMNLLTSDATAGAWKTPIDASNYFWMLPNNISYASSGIVYFSNSATGTTYSTFTTGDIIGIALDMDSGKIYFSKNGVWQGSSNPATGTNPAYTGLTGSYQFGASQGGSGGSNIMNFGQRPFAYTPPTGFKALNTYNLPDSTIVAGNKYMDVVTWTGNGTASGNTQNITTGLNADFMWVKQRDTTNTASHVLGDIVRGNLKSLRTNGTDEENSAGINPLDYDGIQNLGTTSPQMYRGASGTYNGTNGNGKTYVGWTWKANGAGSSNTNGSISATVSANPSAGFSIVTFTSTGVNVNGTVGHGLGVAPKLIITKNTASSSNWVVYHASAVSNVDQFLRLNDTSALTTLSNIWGSALPTSTVFGIRGDVTLVANSAAVAYCWAEVAGFSKFGSYIGNGSAEGTFVYTGFRPKYILLKRSDTSGYSWLIIDTTLNTYNNAANYQQADTATAQGTDNVFDVLSNGFKLRNGGNTENASGGTYIYAAFAENPFKNSLAR